MNKLLLKTATATAVALAIGLSAPAMANDTSSAIRGTITDPSGNAATGTVVTITHVPSGTKKTTTVNSSGVFSTKGLRVGGPYRITLDSDTLEDTQINDVYLSLGDVYPLDVTLRSAQSVERISVTGRVINALSGSTGPGNNFTLTDIEDAPSINRDIKDVVRVDPRISVNESGGNAIQCAGGNPRFNSLTVDGARMNDNFGLNSNGYPTTRMPFSFDSIGEISVELAPFDVQYGGFTSCNINAVTKSGDNEISGGFFYDYTSDSFKGDSLEGDDISTGDFDKKTYGFNVGGALIEDKLFFFTSYEKLDGAQIFNYAPLDNGRIDQATIDRIRDISINNYDYNPGTIVPSMPVEDEKLLVKIDWNINENHRANFVYNYNDGFELSQSDGGSSRLSLSNHFYERGAELQSYVASLYSEWSDEFSTEMRVGYSKLDNRQISLDQESGFGEIRIDAGDVDVYIGPDDSRQSNKLEYDNLSLKLAGTYYLEDHEIYFGYEYESLDVFNLFVQHSQTETRFGSIDDFETGTNARVYYGNASSHNPNDAAGEFEYALNTLYVQDTYTLSDYDLTLTYGLRYDWYTSDDVPTHNQNFEDRYGFSNQQNLDGVDLLQPRFGFNWEATDQLEVRGGFGLYSGGNPNVWISNSYSNDGIRNIQFNTKGLQILGPDAIDFNGSGRPGYDVPQSLYDAVGSGTADASTNVTDPNFEIPSEWKYALGATYTTEDEYVLMADLLISRKQDSAIIRNLADEKVSTAPDGRPVYDSVNHSRNSDLLLTNVDGNDAKSTIVSLSMNKSYDNGVKVSASYAYSDVKDVHPMTSSVAFSNYHNIAVVDPENPVLSTSNYEIPHRFTLSVSYSHEFIDGYQTKFSVFGQANEGRPYTYSFDSDTRGLGFNDSSRQLLYVPLENDPLVVYGEDFDLAAFNNFIESEGLKRGEIMGRNTLQSDWWVKFDLKIEQEFAGFSPDHKASAYLTIKNIGNLLNDDWGVLKQGSFLQGALTATVTDDNKYSYNEFNNPSPQSRVTDPSLWEMKLGVRYKF
ncbi:TonB-dependent receptor [Psychrobium sp. MM17-31]|uniref:TonB-dependent receptor n=1 Tax=Psychrobium sp. MM17-31 TaxID=2917758 RepID=UPI001EF69ED5|nr:TonB-dependent receptor [Psychrobium sp. MM17-31]MCG7531877.1 TonB-dependent receptor [Psychrobium sp. MM17-31]